MFPQSHPFPNLVMWCQAKYNPPYRIVVAHDGDILISITPETIKKILMIPENDSLSHFFAIVLMDLYHNLAFPQRARIVEIFLPKDVELPYNNPPYPTSMFPERAKHIISLVSFLLGYQIDQWVDEPILGYLYIFSKGHKPTFMYNYSQFLAENMHEQLMKITTEGVFKYSSVLVHMFLFQQGDMLPISIHK